MRCRINNGNNGNWKVIKRSGKVFVVRASSTIRGGGDI